MPPVAEPVVLVLETTGSLSVAAREEPAVHKRVVAPFTVVQAAETAVLEPEAVQVGRFMAVPAAEEPEASRIRITRQVVQPADQHHLPMPAAAEAAP